MTLAAAGAAFGAFGRAVRGATQELTAGQRELGSSA